MDDLNVFGILTPCEGYEGENAATAFRQPHNNARYLSAAGTRDIATS